LQQQGLHFGPVDVKMVRYFGGGRMNAELREQVIEFCEKAMQSAGASSYDVAAQMASAQLRALSALIRKIRTRQSLSEALDGMALSQENENLLRGVLDYLPALAREAIRIVAEKATSSLPPLPPGRRRKVSGARISELLDHVSKLNRQGTTLKVAKMRAAQKFQCSQRTVDRHWANRASSASVEPSVGEMTELVRTWLCTGPGNA
jgi:hypothetical protein